MTWFNKDFRQGYDDQIFRYLDTLSFYLFQLILVKGPLETQPIFRFFSPSFRSVDLSFPRCIPPCSFIRKCIIRVGHEELQHHTFPSQQGEDYFIFIIHSIKTTRSFMKIVRVLFNEWWVVRERNDCKVPLTLVKYQVRTNEVGPSLVNV